MSCGTGDVRAPNSGVGDAGAAVLHWTALPTPPSGSVRALAMARNGAIVAGTTSGLYASRDNGTSWRPAGLDSSVVEALFVTRAGAMLLGTYREGLFRSVDNGASWRHAGFERNVYLYGLAQDQDGSVYVSATEAVDSTTPTGVFRSVDDGKTWTPVGLGKRQVWSLSIPLPGSLYAGTDSGLFVSRDKGQTWTNSTNGLPSHVPVSGVIADGPTLLAATGMRQDAQSGIVGDGIFRSEDGGDTWSRADRGIPPRTSVRALLAFGDTMLAAAGNPITGGGSGIYRSVKQGDWHQVGLDGEWVRGLARLPGGRVLATANDAAMFRSDDGARTWIASADGFSNWETYGVAAGHGGRLYASSGRGTYASVDGGAHWLQPHGPSIALVTLPDGRLIGSGMNGHVYRSANDGKSWEALTIPNQKGPVRVVHVDARGRIFAAVQGTGGGVHESDDQGRSWRELDLRRPKTAAEWQGAWSVTTTASGAIIAGATNGIQRSSDGRAPEIVADGVGAFALSACGRDTVFAAAYERGLLRSTDDGRTWTPLTEQLRTQSQQKGYLTLMSVLCLGSGRVMIGSLGNGVFLSEDDGTTWRSVSAGLRSTNVWSLGKDADGRIVAATSAGVHRLVGLSGR